MKSSRVLTGCVVGSAALAIAASFIFSQRGTAFQPRTDGQVVSKAAEGMDVVFVLDTTASMSQLIEGAKRKIWSIASKLQASNSDLDLRIGLVAYRDMGDRYITKVVPLSSDMDNIYAQLVKFRANGGGDGPEHVNRGLHDALNKMQWRGNKTDRHIFLVGDAPPHDDYNDVPKSHDLAKDARERGISLHAIRCGTDVSTKYAWTRIASLGGGTYASIAQSGGMQQVATEYDRELKKLNDKLADTVVGYGKNKDRVRRYVTMRKGMGTGAAAENASYASSAKKIMEGDLIDDMAAGDADITALPESSLPKAARGKNAEERRAWARKVRTKREKLKAKIRALSAKRYSVIRKSKPAAAAPSFDETVVKAAKRKRK